MRFIDLSSTQLKDESCEYVDLNHMETEIFESRFIEDTHEIIHGEEAYSDKSQINSHDVASVESTKAKLCNLKLERDANDVKSHKTVKEVPESLEQRLARIKSELEEIKMAASDSVNPLELQELENLHQQLVAASNSKMIDLRKRLCETAAHGTDSVVLPHITMNFEDSKRVLELDQRISELETRVGIPGDWESDNNRSMMTKLEVLFRQIKVLKNDGDTLNQFHERLTRIDRDYKDSLAGRKAKNDPKLYDAIRGQMTTQESKVEELYKYHELLERYGPIFPQLLDRVKQLSTMSDKIMESYDLARAINSNVVDLQSQANKWEDILNSIEKKLDQQGINMNKNVEHVRKRIAALENKTD